MSAENAILERFQALPRSARWLTLAVAFTVLVLGWDATLGNMARDWNESADSVERQVHEVHGSSKLKGDLKRMENTIVGLGDVRRPGSDSEGRIALTRAYNEIMKNYTVSEDSFDTSGGGDKLPKSVSTGITRRGARLARLSGNLKFTSSAEDAAAIIADFERHPDIESVSKVRITKDERRKVKVTLTVEVWVEVSGRR